jgi:hypothetical protein
MRHSTFYTPKNARGLFSFLQATFDIERPLGPGGIFPFSAVPPPGFFLVLQSATLPISIHHMQKVTLTNEAGPTDFFPQSFTDAAVAASFR